MKKILAILLVAFVIMQFFPIDKTNPAVNKGTDFLTIKKTPPEIATLIKTSCYDCHSNESVYPWYAKIQPVGWFLKHHIDEGREELNFNDFANYEPLRQAKKMNKAAHEIEEGEMPLESYILIHTNAGLTEQNKQILADYFRKIKTEIAQANNISDEELQRKPPRKD